MEASQIREIAKAMSDYGLAEVALDEGGTHLVMRAKGAGHPACAPTGEGAPARGGTPADPNPRGPAAPAVRDPEPGAADGGAADGGGDLLVVSSPMVGVFYVAPAPGEDPFVSVGDEVREGQVLCIVEAMKMMNEVGSPAAGVVREVLAGDSEPVEFDQPLFRIEPLG